jgi:hypothetical protein
VRRNQNYCDVEATLWADWSPRAFLLSGEVTKPKREKNLAFGTFVLYLLDPPMVAVAEPQPYVALAISKCPKLAMI